MSDLYYDSLNKRQKEIYNMVNDIKPDVVDEYKKQYAEQLEHYIYIDNVGSFSILKMKGVMRYINKYDKQIRYGGLVVKIYEDNNKWFAKIKKINGKMYDVSFDNNYIFYKESNKHRINDWLRLFVKQVEDGYISVIE